MKVSLNWLKELANIETINADKLASTLTQAGFEVEDIESISIGGEIDYILDISSTANRADALSMIGLSREVAALNKSQMVEEAYNRSQLCSSNKNSIINDSELLHCSSYFSAIIDDIVITDSPIWLQNRLQSSGFVSKDLLSDISDYIMLKWGQPISIINFKKMTNSQDILKISSDFCSEDSTSVQIDNVNVKLGKETLVTKLNGNVTTVAGIALNNQLQIDKNTKSIFVQAAIFKQSIVRRSSKILNIRTEGSIRQERGLNRDNWENAYLEAICLILQLANGNVRETFSSKKRANNVLCIKLSIKKVQDILGPINSKGKTVFLSSHMIQDILKSLNFHITNENEQTINIIIPHYRQKDVYREIDIIEEIARIHGYQNFDSSIPRIQFTQKLSQRKNFVKKCRTILRNLGLTELVHYSLTKSRKAINLNNPLIQDYSSLRYSLIEGLIESNAYNMKQSNQTMDSFEIGTVFHINQDTIVEKTKLALIIGGNLDIRSEWSQPAHSLNWYEAKGIVENFFCKLNKEIKWVKAESSDAQSHLIQNKKAAKLVYNKNNVGIFGELNQFMCSNLGVNIKLFVLEIDLHILQDLECQSSHLDYQVKSYSKYPSITRDLSIVIPQSMEIRSLLELLSQFHDSDLEKTTLFDEYKSKSFGSNKKSIGIRFTYRSDKKTLTNLEIDIKQVTLQSKIIEQLKLEVRT